jgi:hypothetical protein
MAEIKKDKKGSRVEDRKGIFPLKRSFAIRHK